MFYKIHTTNFVLLGKKPCLPLQFLSLRSQKKVEKFVFEDDEENMKKKKKKNADDSQTATISSARAGTLIPIQTAGGILKTPKQITKRIQEENKELQKVHEYNVRHLSSNYYSIKEFHKYISPLDPKPLYLSGAIHNKISYCIINE